MKQVFLTLGILSLTAALPDAAASGPKKCPPGLAKKAVPCVPPGQVKKRSGRMVIHRYGVGDVIGNYIVIRNPSRYNLNPAYTYYRSDGYIYRVDEDTRKVINLIGAVADFLN